MAWKKVRTFPALHNSSIYFSKSNKNEYNINLIKKKHFTIDLVYTEVNCICCTVGLTKMNNELQVQLFNLPSIL